MKNVLLFLTAILFLAGISIAQVNNPKFSGLIFGDYFYNASSHDSSTKDFNGFQFRRKN